MLPIIAALLFQLAPGAAWLPARLASAVAPNHPPNAVAGTCVLAEVPVDARGRVGEVTILQGLGPFNEPATAAIQQWQFRAASLNGEAAKSTVGVLTVFRPHTFGNIGVGGPALGYQAPTPPQNNHPALPVAITDPGYPQMATTAGVVIIEVTIDKNGIPSNMQTVVDVPLLTDVTRDAIRSWRYMPAMQSGQAVNGTVIVAVSYVRPVVSQ